MTHRFIQSDDRDGRSAIAFANSLADFPARVLPQADGIAVRENVSCFDCSGLYRDGVADIGESRGGANYERANAAGEAREANLSEG